MKKMMKADTLDMTHTELEDEDRDERKNAVGNLIDIETKQDGIEMGSIRVSTNKDNVNEHGLTSDYTVIIFVFISAIQYLAFALSWV